MGSILITGASGFAGRFLMQSLDPVRHPSVTCLCHRQRAATCQSTVVPVRHIPGDLTDPATYEQALEGIDTVIHLAAVTAKAKPGNYFRVNAEGTRVLADRARAAGVRNFLLVSTIAAKFPETRRYYYAQSKRQAEETVRSSGLRFAIVRPTILVGPGAPVLAGMERLADLPVIPVFGDGETVVQPLDVRDLVGFLLALVQQDAFEGDTFELGGADVLSMEELLLKLRQLRKGRAGRVLHVPLGVIIPVLSFLEPLLGPLLPVTVGQLSSFRFDGTATPHPRAQQVWPQRKSIDQMLADAYA